MNDRVNSNLVSYELVGKMGLPWRKAKAPGVQDQLQPTVKGPSPERDQAYYSDGP